MLSSNMHSNNVLWHPLYTSHPEEGPEMKSTWFLRYRSFILEIKTSEQISTGQISAFYEVRVEGPTAVGA